MEEQRMDDYERAKGLSEKIDFSDWEWLPEEITKAVSEDAARTVILSLIRGGAFVTWDDWDGLIGFQIGPLLVKFRKSDLAGDTAESLSGVFEVELSGDWQ